MKREYWKNRRSLKYLSLRKTFSSLKQIGYQHITAKYLMRLDEVRAYWYSLAKKIRLKNELNKQITIECLEGLPVNSVPDRYC